MTAATTASWTRSIPRLKPRIAWVLRYGSSAKWPMTVAKAMATQGSRPTVGVVRLTLDGVASDYFDTGHVLDTGGYDTANYNHLHTGDGGVPVSNTNESLNRRAIGTTGINDPGGGGGMPEPASGALMLLGFGGLGAEFRRRRQVQHTA